MTSVQIQRALRILSSRSEFFCLKSILFSLNRASASEERTSFADNEGGPTRSLLGKKLLHRLSHCDQKGGSLSKKNPPNGVATLCGGR